MAYRREPSLVHQHRLQRIQDSAWGWLWQRTGGEGDGDPFRSVRVSPAGERLDDEPLHPPLNGHTSTARMPTTP